MECMQASSNDTVPTFICFIHILCNEIMREICKIGYWRIIHVGSKPYKRDLAFSSDMCASKKIAIDSVHEKLEKETISRVPLNARTTEVRRKNNIIPKPKFFAIAAVKTNRRFFIFFKHLPVLFISEGNNNVLLYPKKCLCPCKLCTYHIS